MQTHFSSKKALYMPEVGMAGSYPMTNLEKQHALNGLSLFSLSNNPYLMPSPQKRQIKHFAYPSSIDTFSSPLSP